MSYKVLIVDDEAPIRKALSQTINRPLLDCEIYDTASNGKDAIKKLEQENIDLVITDVRMPLIDGIELSRYIYEQHPHTHVIILSGYAEFTYAQSAIQYHVSKYLLKPVAKNQLIEAVKDVLKDKLALNGTDSATNIDNDTSDNTASYSFFVKQALTYIDTHLTEDLSLDSIAKNSHSNASYLSRMFKKEVGKSLITYITDQRIEKAKALLHTDMRTSEISVAVGIQDPAYFSVLFKKYTGMSPKQFRGNMAVQP